MNVLPRYVVFDLSPAMESFVDDLDEFPHSSDLLVEVLQQLPEVMQDMANSDNNVSDFIAHQINEYSLPTDDPDTIALSESIRQLANALKEQVLLHRLLVNGEFPYYYHGMKTGYVVFVQFRYLPQL